MEENTIRKYAELMKELGLVSLEITENGSVIRLETSPDVKIQVPDTKVKESPESLSDLYEVHSPMVGVFYRAPAENAAPFVEVGTAVRRGDILCIIEAMKLMNEIVAEQDGIVEEICVENNQVVDFGRVLFRIRKEKT